MGRIKSTMIKRTAKQLIPQNGDFTGDFEQNKNMLRNTMPSKRIANKVAGYIGRLIRQKESERTKKVIEAEIKEEDRKSTRLNSSHDV